MKEVQVYKADPFSYSLLLVYSEQVPLHLLLRIPYWDKVATDF